MRRVNYLNQIQTNKTMSNSNLENDPNFGGVSVDDDISDATEFSFDFSDVKSDLLPDGEYQAEIVAAKAGKSKGGFPKVDVRWKILDGEYANRQVFDTISIHPNRALALKKLLMALEISDGTSTRFSSGDLIGKSATIHVATEKAQAGTDYPDRNKVSRVSAAKRTVDDVIPF